MPFPLDVTDVQAARQRLQPYLAPTPLYEATSLSQAAGRPVYAKLESLQPTGSFKVRGAFHYLLTMDEAARRRGVVTASAGNHGLGVALAGQRLGARADIFLGADASPAKRAKIARLGATIHTAGRTYDDAHHAAEAFAAETGRPYVHAYADPVVVAGQGTVGLEILAQLPDVGTIIVPVGGGGLIVGIATVVKSLKPGVKLVAVQPDASPALSRSLADGVVYESFDAAPTIADGVAGGVGAATVDLARQGWLDAVVDLPEAATRQAVAWLLREEQWLVEGSAALAVAAVLEDRVPFDGPLCCVLTGANIALDWLLPILQGTP